jgi:hypothetical protein
MRRKSVPLAIALTILLTGMIGVLVYSTHAREEIHVADGGSCCRGD